MTTRSVQWLDTAGKTLYWFPDKSLNAWDTYKVAAVPRSAPNLGIYDASLDDEVSDDWYLFEGASQPTSWDDAITNLELGLYASNTAAETPTPDYSDDELAALSQGFGPRRVKTPNMEVEQYDPLTLQKAYTRQEQTTYPSFADFGVTIVKPNCSKYNRRCGQ